ncbi:MAG: BREX system serine/threonine kinase PglW [Acidimicrobiales bacterium]
MELNSPRWTTVSDSPHDHEREALAFLRRRLYDREPYRVWSNFEFTAPSGALYEVDALAITDNGVHLIEIKSHPGQIGGDGATWQWVTPEGQRRSFDNPRLLASRKAKALKEVLSRSKAFAGRRAEVPFVSEAVFLSDRDLKVTLSPPGRHQVFGRDAEDDQPLPGARSAIGGIIRTLTTLDADGLGRSRRRIDRTTGARIAEAVEQAGIRERSSRRRFGDYRIVDLLQDVEADRDTGVAYQDFLVEHVSLQGLHRRLRLYPLEQNSSTEQREAAGRAARREFQLLRPLLHPGILAPVDYFEHERGPCLLFEYDPDSQRLDRWLLDPPEGIDTLDRLDLVRQVAEALAQAHDSGVFHRALCPSAVLISGRSGDLRAQVANWHAGARVSTGDAQPSLTGTDHVDALAAGDAVLYRAPEYAQPLADPAALDVFSLGCLACTIFTNSPPAPTAGKLREMLASVGFVSTDAARDGVDETLAVFIAELTDRDPASRPLDLGGVLASLDSVEEDWTLPDPTDEPHVAMARRGSTILDGRLKVTGRLGLGSTAFALLVQDSDAGDRVAVLKVAREPSLNPRLEAEASALSVLDHPGIVKLLDGPFDIDGHCSLLLSYAGRRDDAGREIDLVDQPGTRHGRTLAARIGESFDAEVTERFGEDLLDALRYLEEAGVAHRDIKPENLGISPRGRGDPMHLVLFDFSLASAPIDRLDAGTPGYLDPFLRLRGRWDPAVDRYAAAVVLHELCTGAKPVYGDGRADPGLVDAPLRLDAALFDTSVADGLVAFFGRALAPSVEDRHGTAADMLWAWREAFRAGRHPTTQSDHPPDATESPPFEVPLGTTSASPLVGLPLSARAVAALERLEILTVADLLGEQVGRLRQLRGVGAAVRNELVAAVAHLREALSDSGEVADDAPLTVAARALVPRTAPEPNAAVLRAWLGLDGNEQWPSIDTLSGQHGGRERVAEVLAGAKERWLRQVPVRVVRDWVAEELEAMGGVASAEQLAARLARSRPVLDLELAVPDGQHERSARAMVRAAVVVEGERASPRWVRRQLDGPVVIALDAADGPGGNRLADYASALAIRTAELVDGEADAIVGRATLVAALRELDTPNGARPLPDAALAELAASLCPRAAVNSRLELYRAGLPAADALRAARRAFVTVESITAGELSAKVAARFPAAEALPGRPDLDQLLAGAGVDLRWDPVQAAYLAPSPTSGAGSSGTDLSRHATAVPTNSVTPVEIDAAADFEDRLLRSLDSGSLLVLVTEPKWLERCAEELGRLPVTVIDFDDWLLDEIGRLTEAGRPSWDLIVEVDAAGPGSARWSNLAKIIDRALDSLTARLIATPGTVLLRRCGLLARYQRLDVVARWRDALHGRSSALGGLWLLVSAPGTTDVPLLDGEAVPVLTRNEWVRVPNDWLRNAHRAVGSAR